MNQLDKQIPLTLKTSVALTGHMPDGDYTADFLEAGTTFTAQGEHWGVKGDIPVTHAHVKDDVLYLEGQVYVSL